MDQEPLVMVRIDGGRRLIGWLAEEGVGVTAACWAREEGGGWFLYLATDLVSEDGATKQAYRRLIAVMRRLPGPPGIDPLDVKLVGPNDPVARAVQELHERFPGSLPLRSGDARFGGLGVEEVYVYPPASTPVS